MLDPNLKVGGPVSPGPYGCCAYDDKRRSRLFRLHGKVMSGRRRDDNEFGEQDEEDEEERNTWHTSVTAAAAAAAAKDAAAPAVSSIKQSHSSMSRVKLRPHAITYTHTHTHRGPHTTTVTYYTPAGTQRTSQTASLSTDMHSPNEIWNSFHPQFSIHPIHSCARLTHSNVISLSPFNTLVIVFIQTSHQSFDRCCA